MAKELRDESEQEHVPTEKKLEQLYDLIDGIETAMFTSRRPDGSLVSRPMQTQARRAGTDLWFMTSIDSGKMAELLYLKATKPRLLTLFSVAKAIATGDPPKAGDMGKLDRQELANGAPRS